MKKYTLMFIVALIFLNGFGTGDVSAQTLKVIRFEVDFEFRVGKKTYPAGVYRVETLSPGNENLLHLRGESGKNQQLLMTDDLYADERQTPKLVFHRIGDEYYLMNVFMTNGGWGFSVTPSHRRLAGGRKLASTKTVEVFPKN